VGLYAVTGKIKDVAITEISKMPLDGCNQQMSLAL
jgi:hypothetical protein